MILAIDIGNTNIVVGCIDKEKIYFIERLSTVRTKTELEYAIDLKTVLDIYHIKRTDIEGCIISSVVPQITNVAKLAAEKILKKEVLGSGTRSQDRAEHHAGQPGRDGGGPCSGRCGGADLLSGAPGDRRYGGQPLRYLWWTRKNAIWEV